MLSSHAMLPRRLLLLALIPAMGLALGACRTMRRTLTIDSVPCGATVWIDGTKQAKSTPVTVPFTWYGWFEVRLEKEGYQHLAGEVHVPTQTDGYPVVDLVLERVTPDHHVRRTFRLQPLVAEPSEDYLAATRQRAEALREAARRAVPPAPRRPR